MTDTFPERLPFPFSRRTATLADSPLSRSGREIHFVIAGQPFRVHVDNDTPMSITTAPTQKDQQDVEPEAGENSLSGWWLRNQASWHEGAGAQYMEARGEVKDTFRFWESSNIDVWTAGELSMLRRDVTLTDGAVNDVAMIPESQNYTAGQVSILVSKDGAIETYADIDSGGTNATMMTEAGVDFGQVIAADARWYTIGNAIDLVCRVYTGAYDGAGATEAWQLTNSNPAAGSMRILYAKHRLWAVNGPRIYTLTTGLGGTPASPTAVDPIYTHPDSSFVFTDLCDGPGGVFFSGYGDGSSGLQKITLNTDGSVPTLNGAVVTAVLPNDEKIYRISSLASSMILLLTNRGVRVAVADSSGEMVYGPRFMDRDELSSSAIPSLCSAGRWWWLCWGDEAKVWRIDSSTSVEDGVFAYASDFESGATNFMGLSVRNERPVICTVAGDLAWCHATEKAATGYLTSGRIRYRTDEMKSFQRIAITAAPLAGTAEVVALNDADSERPLITYSEQGHTDLAAVDLPSEANPMRFMSVKLNFTRSTTDAAQGPTIYGVQVKALPASKPQRIFQIPLDCYDEEEWSTGYRDGYAGFANVRYQALKDAEDAGSPVILRDYTVDPAEAVLCRLEEVKLIRTTQPNADYLDGSWGGILLVTLRTLT